MSKSEAKNREILWDKNSLTSALNLSEKTQKQLADFTAHGVCADSREIQNGDIFIAIKGERFDGASFIPEALAAGAVFCITDGDIKSEDTKILKVDNIVETLAEMAKYRRQLINPQVVAITGSNGKTSTKSMLYLMLNEQLECHTSNKNYNTEIGLPLTILNMPATTEVLLLEMAMRGSGQIRHLSQIAKPNIAIITNIHVAHIGKFSSLSAIAEAKSEIFDGMEEGGMAILNYDDKYYNVCKNFAEIKGLKVLSFGRNQDAFFHLMSEQSGKIRVCYDRHNFYDYVLGVETEHQILNSVAATAALKLLQCDFAFGLRQLQQFKALAGRGEVSNIHGKIIIDEAYNASPESMMYALKSLKKYKGKKLVILGDMLELGADEIQYHQQLAPYIIEQNIDSLITVGKLILHLRDKVLSHSNGNLKIESYANADELLSNLKDIIMLYDVILVKASNSIGLGKVVNAIKDLLSNDRHIANGN